MDKKLEKFLPIGSVLLLKGAKHRVMITGYLMKTKHADEKVWDYVGCPFPEGIVSVEKQLFFDHEQIDIICAVGLTDEEENKFVELVKEQERRLLAGEELIGSKDYLKDAKEVKVPEVKDNTIKKPNINSKFLEQMPVLPEAPKMPVVTNKDEE